MRSFKERMHSLTDSIEPLRNFFKTTAKCLDPDAYHAFSRKKLAPALGYLLAVVTLAVVLLGLLSIPTLINMPARISDTLSQFDVLTLTPQFSTTEPVHVDLAPVLSATVTIDTKKETNLTDGQTDTVLVDAETITVRKTSAHCSLRAFAASFTVFGYGFQVPESCYEQYTISEFTDLLSEKETVSKLVWLWSLYTLPLLFVWLVFKFFLSYAVLAGLVVLFSGLVLKGLHSKVGYAQNFKLALYALTIPVIVEVASVPFDTQLYAIHWLIGLGYYILSLYLAGGDEGVKDDKIAKVAGGKKPMVWKKE